jgi:hypothetical protein
MAASWHMRDPKTHALVEIFSAVLLGVVACIPAVLVMLYIMQQVSWCS